MSSVCYWFNTNRKTIYTFLSSKIPVALKSSRFVHFWVSVTLIVKNHATYIHRSVDIAKRFETPLRVFQFHLPTYLKNSTVHFPRPSLFSHSSYLFTGGYGGQRPPALFHSFPHLCPPRSHVVTEQRIPLGTVTEQLAEPHSVMHPKDHSYLINSIPKTLYFTNQIKSRICVCPVRPVGSFRRKNKKKQYRD